MVAAELWKMWFSVLKRRFSNRNVVLSICGTFEIVATIPDTCEQMYDAVSNPMTILFKLLVGFAIEKMESSDIHAISSVMVHFVRANDELVELFVEHPTNIERLMAVIEHYEYEPLFKLLTLALRACSSDNIRIETCVFLLEVKGFTSSILSALLDMERTYEHSGELLALFVGSSKRYANQVISWTDFSEKLLCKLTKLDMREKTLSVLAMLRCIAAYQILQRWMQLIFVLCLKSYWNIYHNAKTSLRCMG
jgi:hypothetical protein